MSKMPVSLLVVGMAGSGKSTFVQRLHLHLLDRSACSPYLINLDPAIPFFEDDDEQNSFNIDIRDSVDYKGVMKEYNLGPNGAILTCLNLFATKFDQVIDLVEKRTPSHVLVDTPGQIEIFTWSASGSIISGSFSQHFPTVLVYIVDTVRCIEPGTFISNMLYACSIMYKAKLPFLVVFNKTDLQDSKFCVDWMTDFETFQEALHGSEHEESFSFSLIHSMSLVLEEFYAHMKNVSVSAATGQGMDDFLKAVDEIVNEEMTNIDTPRNDENNAQNKESGIGSEHDKSYLNSNTNITQNTDSLDEHEEIENFSEKLNINN